MISSLKVALSAGDNFIIKLAYDFYGNYTLQDLIEAASRLRAASTSLLKAKKLTEAQANSASGVVKGQDYLGTAPAKLQYHIPHLLGLKLIGDQDLESSQDRDRSV